MTEKRRRRIVTVAWLPALATALLVRAQPTPRPIRHIVPYPPGDPLDIVARALADKVKDSLVVVVDNKPGAGGNLGAGMVARTAPNGTTPGSACSGQRACPPT